MMSSVVILFSGYTFLLEELEFFFKGLSHLESYFLYTVFSFSFENSSITYFYLFFLL